MIYLCISDSHLFCAQWTDNEGKHLLNNLAYKPLQKSITDSNRTVNEIVSDINGTLQLIRENISFEGEKVYVSVPDSYCNTALVSMDKDMTENDGWEFAKWTIDQRWPIVESVEYFGRAFSEKSNCIYAIRVPTTFREPLKLAIQEVGAETVWMGTESSVFFGLNPNIGNTVFNVDKNGYSYFSYTKNIFQSGFARFYKNEWKIDSFNGSSSAKDAFKGMLISAGKLSYRRKQHFDDLRIKQLEALSGVDVEANIIPKDVNEKSLLVLTALIKGTIDGVAINFFDQPGLQEYQHDKTKVLDPPKKNQSDIEQSTKRPKARKKDRKFLQFFLYLFFFSVIGSVLTFNKKPELFDNLLTSMQIKSIQIVNNLSDSAISFFDSSIDGLEDVSVEKNTSKIEAVNKDIAIDIQPPTHLLRSQSLIASIVNAFSLTQAQNLLMLSVSSGRLNIEFVGPKTQAIPVGSIGDILNYSLRQVTGEDQFKHGFLVNYKQTDISKNSYSNISISNLESFVNDFDDSFIKILDTIDSPTSRKVPVIIRIQDDDNIKKMLKYLSINGSNASLEKFVYKKQIDGSYQSAVYYIAIYDQPDS